MRGMLQSYLLIFLAYGFLSGRSWAAGAMTNAGLPLPEENLHAHRFQVWKSLEANPFPETEWKFVYAGWLQDSDNALKQSIAWAMQVRDADYLKQILFLVALDRDPGTGEVSFHTTSDEGTSSTHLEYARLRLGVLTLGDYEFQMGENRIVGWRQASGGTSFDSFPLPIEIPLTILERFRTQA